MKRRPKKARSPEDERTKANAKGFREGERLTRLGIATRLRLCGLAELGNAVEDDDGFLFALEAHRLRDHAAARRAERERKLDRPRPTQERQLGLFDGGTGSNEGASASKAITRASISKRSSERGSSSRKARTARS